eukprot:scaffold115307_cov60-Phaeocystis_antarctica.AAC.2
MALGGQRVAQIGPLRPICWSLRIHWLRANQVAVTNLDVVHLLFQRVDIPAAGWHGGLAWWAVGGAVAHGHGREHGVQGLTTAGTGQLDLKDPSEAVILEAVWLEPSTAGCTCRPRRRNNNCARSTCPGPRTSGW